MGTHPNFVDYSIVSIAYLETATNMFVQLSTNTNISLDESLGLLNFVYSQFGDMPKDRIAIVCITNMAVIADEGVAFPLP